MKWPGLKLGSRNYGQGIRAAHEVAEDNAIDSSPNPDEKEIKRSIMRVTKALIELETSVIRMLIGRRK